MHSKTDMNPMPCMRGGAERRWKVPCLHQSVQPYKGKLVDFSGAIFAFWCSEECACFSMLGKSCLVAWCSRLLPVLVLLL